MGRHCMYWSVEAAISSVAIWLYGLPLVRESLIHW